PTLLDDPPAVLGPLDGRPGHRETRHCDRLAPHRLPALLALAIAATRGPAEDHRRNSRSDPTLGAREPGLGSAEDPRRTPETRLGRLGTDRRAVSATPTPPRQHFVT